MLRLFLCRSYNHFQIGDYTLVKSSCRKFEVRGLWCNNDETLLTNEIAYAYSNIKNLFIHFVGTSDGLKFMCSETYNVKSILSQPWA